MPITISIQVPSAALDVIRNRVTDQIQASRSQLVQSAMSAALTEVVDATPLETGAARRGWQAEFSRTQGEVPASSAPDTSSQSATNDVEHVVYLEYGTTRMSPRRIVNSVLDRLRTAVVGMFHFSH